MSKKNSSNPFHNAAFNHGQPTTQKGHEATHGDPFLEEELASEIDEIDDLEKEVEKMEVDRRSISELRDDVRGLDGKLKEASDALLRAHAEMENVRRRAAKMSKKLINIVQKNLSKNYCRLLIVWKRRWRLDLMRNQSHCMKALR